MCVILEKLYNTKVVGNKFRPQQVEEKEKKVELTVYREAACWMLDAALVYCVARQQAWVSVEGGRNKWTCQRACVKSSQEFFFFFLMRASISFIYLFFF